MSELCPRCDALQCFRKTISSKIWGSVGYQYGYDCGTTLSVYQGATDLKQTEMCKEAMKAKPPKPLQLPTPPAMVPPQLRKLVGELEVLTKSELKFLNIYVREAMEARYADNDSPKGENIPGVRYKEAGRNAKLRTLQ
jgi:hypothetical protein